MGNKKQKNLGVFAMWYMYTEEMENNSNSKVVRQLARSTTVSPNHLYSSSVNLTVVNQSCIPDSCFTWDLERYELSFRRNCNASVYEGSERLSGLHEFIWSVDSNTCLFHVSKLNQLFWKLQFELKKWEYIDGATYNKFTKSGVCWFNWHDLHPESPSSIAFHNWGYFCLQ